MILGLRSPASAEWPEQSCRFAHRIPVTITAGASSHNDETRIDLTSVDFPALYAFSPAGDDIRIYESDDTTPVDFVVTGWDDVARTATIYVRLPALAAGNSETISIYLGDMSLGSGANVATVFPNTGVRLHSRVSTADPVSPSDGLAAFNAATTDVANVIRTSISGTNNRSLGGTNGDYGWCVSAILNVTPATAGTWEFRYGGDFGRGGHLFVRGQQIEEQWNDDLWWANNYANTAETLEGSITLPAGAHRYEALGFEGCCDGPTGFQARSPGGAWQDLSSTNFDLRAAQCILPGVTVTVGAPQSCGTTLDATKTVSLLSDTEGSSNPYALPGSDIAYDITVTNPGQSIDAGTIVLTDALPPQIAINVSSPGAFTFTDGANASGLSLNYAGPASTTDGVEFSTDGTDFSYTPTGPVDAAVTHVRFRPTGTFNPNDGGNQPSFTIRIQAVLH